MTTTGQSVIDEIEVSVDAGEDSLLECLLILIKHYGLDASPNALVAGLPLEDGKLTPSLFTRSAKRAGFTSRVVKRGFNRLNALVLPAVLMLEDGEFVVLMELGKKEARVLQPEAGGGSVTLKRKDLEKAYTGYAILVRPEHRFDERAPAPYKQREGHWFWSTLFQSWRIYRDVLLASLLVNSFVLASPLFIMNVYDRVVPNNAVETLWVLAIGVGVVYLFDLALRALRGYFIDLAGRKADIMLSAVLFERVMGMKLSVRPPSVGSFANNLREFDSIRDFITSATITTLVDLPFVVLFLLVIYWVGGPIVLVPVAIIPLIIIYGLIIQVPLRNAVEQTFRSGAQKNSQLIESLVAAESIKFLGAESQQQRRWERTVAHIAKWGARSRILSASAGNVAMFLQQLSSVGVVVFGVYLISEGEISMGGLIATVILSGRAIAPMAQVAGLSTRYYQAKAALNSLNQVMEQPVDRPDDKSFVSRPFLEGSIEFEDVEFNYPNSDVPALRKLSFRMKAGERVAIIGKVGSGKTTIEKLVLGFFEPKEGAVRVDGADVRQLDPADLRRNVGYTPQDVVLFHGTVRENILVGQSGVSDEALLSAAESAGVLDFVNRHPLGFDMPAGERGDFLSGGQRQCVALARALISDPPILLLDEPTSFMDNSTEEAIKQSLKRIVQDKTLILVTHRASLLELVDRIIVLDSGAIVADGPKAEVLEALRQGRIRGGK